MDILYILATFFIPVGAIFIPLGFLIFYITYNNLELAIGRNVIIKYIIASTLISIVIFVILNYLTGSLSYFYYVLPGFYNIEGGFILNFNRHISFSFQYYPGIAILAVSVLSGMLYASLITLPQICTYLPNLNENQELKGKIRSSFAGSTSATISVIASTAVCCSTSVASIIAPTIVTLFGVYASILLYFSLILLIYSFLVTVIPKFPSNP